MSASNPEANVAMAGASQLRARVIQAAMSAAASASWSLVTVLPFQAARTGAVKRPARPVIVRAVSSCSTRLTTAASLASHTEGGWTSNHANCRAGGHGASVPGRCESLALAQRGLRRDRTGLVRRSATKRCICRLVPEWLCSRISRHRAVAFSQLSSIRSARYATYGSSRLGPAP